jgi:hypothetical protein
MWYIIATLSKKPEALPQGSLFFRELHLGTGSGSVSSTRKLWLKKLV